MLSQGCTPLVVLDPEESVIETATREFDEGKLKGMFRIKRQFTPDTFEYIVT